MPEAVAAPAFQNLDSLKRVDQRARVPAEALVYLPGSHKTDDCANNTTQDQISIAVAASDATTLKVDTIKVDSQTGANVFVTSTGGDGGFPIILGLDAQNRPAVLLSDFGSLQMTYSGMKL